MVTNASLTPLLMTVDRVLADSGLDPASLPDDDKVILVTQVFEVYACHEGLLPCKPEERCTAA